MVDFDSELLVSTALDTTFFFLKFWAIIAILFPLWGISYIFIIMLPLWTISDFFNMQGIGMENNGFFIANIFGYTLIALLYWLIFFIFHLIKKILRFNK